MAVNALNAFVANPPIDGGVYFNAPLGTKLPKTAIEALDPAFKDHGAVAEDGFNVSPKRETTTEKMMGGGDFIDIQTSYTEEVEITFMEDDNENVINSCFGTNNVVTKAATNQHGKQVTIYHTEQPLPPMAHVLKAVYGEKKKAYVIERGRITSIEKTRDEHKASTKYKVVITCYKGSVENRGAYVLELRDDGVLAALGG